MKIGRIGDMCTAERLAVSPQEGQGLPYVGLEDVEAGTGAILRSPAALSHVDVQGNAFRFTDEHVLYGKLRPYLNKVAVPAFDGRCSTELIPLRPKPGVLREYLAYALRRREIADTVTAKNTGSRMPRADLGVLMKLPVPIPAEVDQRRIVDILSRTEGIVRLRRQAAKLSNSVIPSLFIDIFGDPISNCRGWPIVDLGAVISDGPQNGLYKPASAYGDGTPILRIDAFYDGEVRDLASLRRLEITEDERRKFGLREGDIVINRVNSPEYLGKSALMPQLAEEIVFESNMMRFSVDRTRIEPRFMIQYLQTAFVKRTMLSKAKHAINQSSINQGDVQSIPVMLPSLTEQERFCRHYQSVQSIIGEARMAMQKANELFESMLQLAFRSEL